MPFVTSLGDDILRCVFKHTLSEKKEPSKRSKSKSKSWPFLISGEAIGTYILLLENFTLYGPRGYNHAKVIASHFLPVKQEMPGSAQVCIHGL